MDIWLVDLPRVGPGQSHPSIPFLFWVAAEQKGGQG